MRRALRVKKRVAALVGACGLVAAGLTASTGSASASTIPSDEFQLCAQGNYPVYATFPQRGGLATTIVFPGDCRIWHISNNPNELAEIYGIDSEGGSIWVSYATFDDASGMGIGAEGDLYGNKWIWEW
jgi:hypothetical protein